MTINFFEPGTVPKPRDEVTIELFEAQVLQDRWRVKITVHVTPFLERPNLAVALVQGEQTVAAEMSILETMHDKMEFTLHVRGVDDPAGNYVLKARLYYDQDIQNAYDHQEIPVVIGAVTIKEEDHGGD